jgi:hypothetical protein
LLREIVAMSGDLSEMKGHLARALWFLGSFEEKLDNPTEAKESRERAKEERLKIRAKEVADEDTDNAFLGQVGWMLWRPENDR